MTLIQSLLINNKERSVSQREAIGKTKKTEAEFEVEDLIRTIDSGEKTVSQTLLTDLVAS